MKASVIARRRRPWGSRTVAAGRALADSLPPEEAARIAWTPTGPPVDELTERIRARRATWGEAAAQ